MTLITKNVTTLTELKTLVNQGGKAAVIYDASAGTAFGLDLEVLINMDASIAGMDDVDKDNYAKAIEPIAHNATAPTPIIPIGTTKTYKFSTGGAVSWLSSQIMEVGDEADVTRTGESTYTRMSRNVLSRKVNYSQIYNGLDKTEEGFALDVLQAPELYAKAIESIAYNAAAPSPIIPTGTTKTYEFSSGGNCTMFTAGAQVVEKGDKMTVAFTAPSTYVRTYQNVISRKADLSLVVQSDASVKHIVALTQAEYDAITEKDSTTLYFIKQA